MGTAAAPFLRKNHDGLSSRGEKSVGDKGNLLFSQFFFYRLEGMAASALLLLVFHFSHIAGSAMQKEPLEFETVTPSGEVMNKRRCDG